MSNHHSVVSGIIELANASTLFASCAGRACLPSRRCFVEKKASYVVDSKSRYKIFLLQ